MAHVEIAREYRGKTSSDCFHAGITAVGKSGYEIFKRRDIANLLICHGTIHGHPAEVNLVVPMGAPHRVVLSLSSEACSEDELKSEAERFFELLDSVVEK